MSAFDRFLLSSALVVCGISSAQTTPDAEAYFETKVRPVLVRDCYGCHGPQAKTAFGNLRLADRASVLKGGDSGPAIVPGKPDDSLLIRAIRYDGSLKMPPTGRLKQADVEVLTEWVKLGAAWPEAAPQTPAKSAGPVKTHVKTVEERRKDHWAWQPIRQTNPPSVKNAKWPDSALDR